jgi:hypothetical protein
LVPKKVVLALVEGVLASLVPCETITDGRGDDLTIAQDEVGLARVGIRESLGRKSGTGHKSEAEERFHDKTSMHVGSCEEVIRWTARAGQTPCGFVSMLGNENSAQNELF